MVKNRRNVNNVAKRGEGESLSEMGTRAVRGSPEWVADDQVAM
jgi:hypothetical protein